ncbi:MAG: Hsp20/alpha crystallin family protein [Spirochaetaceae bacterium]|nr:MAG: Hsp20/alpha crystallin family protein [Spirochaetaceae bacterium]
MKNRDFTDISSIMDEIFSAAEEFKSAFGEHVGYPPRGKGFNWDAQKDFYPFHSYPPANIYMTDDKTLVMEFALAGFRESDIELEVQGEYLSLSATAPDGEVPPENAHYFKRRLKLKSFRDQKYYVPEDKFDRDKVSALFTNGILRVTIPPREGAKPESSRKIPITRPGKNG